MACSRFEYVKQYEDQQRLLRDCYIVVRIDGRSFTEFTESHKFDKPVDARGINLMNAAAGDVMEAFGDIEVGYGHSDEFSFVFKRDTTLWQRRREKLVSSIVSLFSAAYTLRWPQYFTSPLHSIPSFDGRAIAYPTTQRLKDYLMWRQVDCHVNNQYNICFWSLVKLKGLAREEANARLKGTLTKDKNELLFTEFNLNYNELPLMHRKGSILQRHVKSPRRNLRRERRRKEAASQAGSPLTQSSAQYFDLDAPLAAASHTIDSFEGSASHSLSPPAPLSSKLPDSLTIPPSLSQPDSTGVGSAGVVITSSDINQESIQAPLHRGSKEIDDLTSMAQSAKGKREGSVDKTECDQSGIRGDKNGDKKDEKLKPKTLAAGNPKFNNAGSTFKSGPLVFDRYGNSVLDTPLQLPPTKRSIYITHEDFERTDYWQRQTSNED